MFCERIYNCKESNLNPIFYRLAKLRGLAFLGLLLMALAILGSMIWRNLHHFDTAISYVNASHHIQNVSVGLQQSVIDYLTESSNVLRSEIFNDALAHVDSLLGNNEHYLSDHTRFRLETARSLLTNLQKLDKTEQHRDLMNVLKILNELLDNETLQREQMLEDINVNTQSELYVALLMFCVIFIGAIWFLQRRILHPLHDLRELLERLTDENYTTITTKHLDPLLLPVFQSYNGMVKHLSELEESNRQYAQSLQREVRLATQALLEQQHSLARAERLAAIGEVSAELAHEIRNPLAGIQMAFNNLRREIDNENQCERMALIDNELKRLARLLNEMLNASKHTPETPSSFDLSVLIRDLVTLVRYQIPENLFLRFNIPESLLVYFPESDLRQALLNLLLNSADALDGNAGEIVISVSVNDENLFIQVHDNGHGFAQEWLEYGIRPFRTSRERGTGLGLAMVQRFVKNNNGTLTLSNDNGAVVSITLPKIKP